MPKNHFEEANFIFYLSETEYNIYIYIYIYFDNNKVEEKEKRCFPQCTKPDQSKSIPSTVQGEILIKARTKTLKNQRLL